MCYRAISAINSISAINMETPAVLTGSGKGELVHQPSDGLAEALGTETVGGVGPRRRARPSRRPAVTHLPDVEDGDVAVADGLLPPGVAADALDG
jgi:hypothetical protein